MRKQEIVHKRKSLCDFITTISRVRLGKNEEAAFYLSGSCSSNLVINEDVLHFFFNPKSLFSSSFL